MSLQAVSYTHLPGVAPVHQAGLGGQAHLVLQGLTGQLGQVTGGKAPEDILCFGLDLSLIHISQQM